MDNLKNLPFNIALFLVGALFILLGLTSGFTFNTFSFTVQDTWARTSLAAIGILSVITAIYLEIKRNPLKEIAKQKSPSNKEVDDKTPKKFQICADDIFYARESTSIPSFAAMLEECEELWVVGKDCHTLLTSYNELIQKAAMNGKKIRFIIVNHNNQALVHAMAASSVTRPQPEQRVVIAQEAIAILGRIIASTPTGTIEVKLANFIPTYTGTIFDGRKANGHMTVEYYGYKISAGQRIRMHLTQDVSPRTFAFYIEQFDKMWKTSEYLNDKAL